MFEVIIGSRSVNHFHEPYTLRSVRKAISQFVRTVRICRIVNRLTSSTLRTVRSVELLVDLGNKHPLLETTY